MHTHSAPSISQTPAETDVRQAAAALVAAFGAHDVETYFASFAPDATFVFYSNPRMFASRDDYRSEWARWERDGFHVEACSTTGTQISVLGADVAVLTHRVSTRLAGSSEDVRERESIVFRREPDGRWLAVHEHLSADPADADARPQP